MAFYDAFGNVGDAFGNDLFGFDSKREGYQKSQQDAKALADKIQRFQMEGLSRAQGYYQPAVAMNQAIYGTPDMLRK